MIPFKLNSKQVLISIYLIMISSVPCSQISFMLYDVKAFGLHFLLKTVMKGHLAGLLISALVVMSMMANYVNLVLPCVLCSLIEPQGVGLVEKS